MDEPPAPGPRRTPGTHDSATPVRPSASGGKDRGRRGRIAAAVAMGLVLAVLTGVAVQQLAGEEAADEVSVGDTAGGGQGADGSTSAGSDSTAAPTTTVPTTSTPATDRSTAPQGGGDTDPAPETGGSPTGDAPAPTEETPIPEPGGRLPADRDLRVLVLGDSIAFTAHHHAGPGPYDGIASIDGRAATGCGLLSSRGWHYEWGDDGFVSMAACEPMIAAEQEGLAQRPDVVLLMPGAWESVAVRSPHGEVVPARSARMADVLVEAMLERIRAADAAGARTVVVPWACPGPQTSPPLRDPAYTTWINSVFERTAAEGSRSGFDVAVLDVTTEVCVDGDPEGRPTPAKDVATGGEVHVADDAGGRWLWSRWLAPGLTGRPPTG